jgi:leucyl-tRNA synthetase
MQGFEVLHPMVGMPLACGRECRHQTGQHPATWTYANIEKQRASLMRMAFSYD